MDTVQLRDAKASLSKLVEAAEAGEPTVITKHGREAAMLVPIAEGRKLYPAAGRSFLDHLLAYPGGLELEPEDVLRLRDVDLD
ncbi:type II toxin-antitoxin system Phd/YefM family antitoxin [Oharaeibacter diazotrophicus]|uniref:Antitoxin n=1 Tax=Oharaeibacter diazotrophicus TaxID=1920512 RepID=A0A4R6RAP8_9HYPH|nr:type II toxin-antitoxin system Phd/YefM family antitoxin [Oharaeibacter diazotrophicus]TDP83180.1 prevent-host-death family protein [Oharaeibacter diazotrophicus]BBE72009.1 Phd_YefM protein [Pleomorphomonas sp. SM30]GLS78774.1 hypothetical protein GCM10007904_41110 [Oharaeibacter diazotrophicus]